MCSVTFVAVVGHFIGSVQSYIRACFRPRSLVGIFGHVRVSGGSRSLVCSATFAGLFGNVRGCVRQHGRWDFRQRSWVCSVTFVSVFGLFYYGDVTLAKIRQAFKPGACGILTDVFR